MSNPKQNSNYADLISRYLSGMASDAEVQRLEDWVLADEEHKATFLAAKKTWILAGMGQETSAIDVEKAWKHTQQLTQQTGKVAPMRGRRRWWLSVAAGAAILIVAALGLIWNSRQQAWTEVVAQRTVMSVDLPDGTRVNLNRGSRLRYPTKTPSTERRVQLTGGAFFEVERNVDRPFIVEATPLEVEVLGTSFYVDARPTEPAAQVIVESGQVRVSAQGQQTELAASEKVIFTKSTGELSPAENTDQNYRSLITDALVFDNSSIQEVVFALKRHFGVEMTTEITDPTNCEITATYENKSLEAILLILESTLGIEVTRQDGQILLSAAGCR